jgi:hypothetical protein
MNVYVMTNAANRVWMFDHTTYGGWKKDGGRNVGKGLCAGMTICWILLRADDQDFPTRVIGDVIEVDPTSDQCTHIKRFQDAMIQKDGPEGYQDHFGDKFNVDEHFQVKAKSGYSEVVCAEIANYVAGNSDCSAASVTSAKNKVKTWYLVRGHSTDKSIPGRHAIAIEVSGTFVNQKFRLMDPSCGCFKFGDQASFQTWLNET